MFVLEIIRNLFCSGLQAVIQNPRQQVNIKAMMMSSQFLCAFITLTRGSSGNLKRQCHKMFYMASLLRWLNYFANFSEFPDICFCPWLSDVHDSAVSMTQRCPWLSCVLDSAVSMTQRCPWLSVVHDGAVPESWVNLSAVSILWYDFLNYVHSNTCDIIYFFYDERNQWYDILYLLPL